MNELAILDAMQAWHSPVLDGLVAAFTSTSNHGELWILLGIVLVCFRRTRKAGVGVLVAVALGAVVTNLLVKPLIMRPRPCDVNAAVAMIVPRPSGSSFPSGHTTAAFAAAAALWFARDPKAPGALVAGVTVAAVLMGLSRMYCYVHYPTDVLAGALVGTLAGLAAARIMDALAKRRQAARTPIPRGPGGSESAGSPDDTPDRRGPGASA
ncbi:phosphatase PAP2 family protein [Eggerthellaceae bacterium 24-137]